MSSRARRLGNATSVVAFPWDRQQRSGAGAGATGAFTFDRASADQARLDAVDRDAFARGFAQGEAAAAAAAGERAAALLGELTAALQDVAAVRHEMARRTERQLVELALALARRIVTREVAVDRDLLLAMARVAIDRLGESARVTVRLHADDYEATVRGRRAPNWPNVTVVADPQVAPGACRVESDLGVLEAGADAQLQECRRALLGETASDTVPPLGHVA